MAGTRGYARDRETAARLARLISQQGHRHGSLNRGALIIACIMSTVGVAMSTMGVTMSTVGVTMSSL